MKKAITYLLSALLFAACSPSTGNSEYLNVERDNIDIPSNKTTETLHINASGGCEWRITWDASQPWIKSIQPANGRGAQPVTITLEENTTISERSAVLTISNTNGNIPARTVTIKHLAGSPTLTLGSTLQTFSGDGGTQTFTVKSNTFWQVSGFNDWCHADGSSSGSGDGSVTVRVDANPDEKARPLTLTLTASGVTPIEVSVRQDAATTLRNSGESFKTVAATAGTCEFSIIGTARWSASISQITGSWARITEPDGEVTGDGRIIIAYDDNTSQQSRELVVTCHWPRSSSDTVKVTVVQEAGEAPTVTAPVASGISRTSATLTATYLSAFPVTRYGFCYTVLRGKEPDLTDTVVPFSGSSNSGSISTHLDNLTSGRRYYVRAFAESVVGIAYSEIRDFTTYGDTPGEGDNTPPSDI